MVARGNPRQAVLVLRRLLDNIESILDDRVYLCIVLLHVLLRKLEEGTLGVLHQLIYVDGFVKCLRLHVTGKLYELAGQELLGNDVSMVLDVGRRGHTS